MKKETVDLGTERKLISLLIMNTEVGTKLLPILKPNLLKTSYAKLVAQWCIDYYEAYKVAPESNIKGIWESHRASINDEETLESVGSFLTSLSDDFDPEEYNNTQYHIDLCEAYLRTNNVRNLQDKLEALLSTGKVEEAEAAVAGFKHVSVPTNEGVSILSNLDVFQDAFEHQQAPLFRLDGALGSVAGDFFRGDFSAGLASQKAGKSWFLSHVGLSALEQGCNVLHVNFEMREGELYRRAWKMMNWAPDIDSVVDMPYFKADLEPGQEIDETTRYNIMHKNISKQGVSFSDKGHIEQMLKMRYRGDMRFVTLPSGSTWGEVEALLNNLEYYSNYHVDLLVLDYIDLMGSKEKEYRHRMNDLWENARRVAQQRHIHVCSVSQTNKSGLKGEEITAEAVSEDSRKNSHVAKLLGLYGTSENRQASYIFVKNLISRYRVESYEAAVVLQQLDIGRWCVDSMLQSKVMV